MQWFGWIWIGQWERVTGPHETPSLCSRALDKIGVERGVPGRHQVMTGGGPPTFTPVGRSAAKTARRPVKAENEAL
jgi:hypothetical protein